MGRENNGALTTALLVLSAGLVGAALGLLFAPQPGKRTRRDLRRFGTRVVNRADEFQHDLRVRAEDLVHDTLAAGQNTLSKGKEASERLRRDLVTTLESGKEILTEQVGRVEQLLSRK